MIGYAFSPRFQKTSDIILVNQFSVSVFIPAHLSVQWIIRNTLLILSQISLTYLLNFFFYPCLQYLSTMSFTPGIQSFIRAHLLMMLSNAVFESLDFTFPMFLLFPDLNFCAYFFIHIVVFLNSPFYFLSFLSGLGLNWSCLYLCGLSTYLLVNV